MGSAAKMALASCVGLCSLLAPACAQLPLDRDVTVLDDTTFPAAILEQQFVFVMFYAPWCPHCQDMMPRIEAVARVAKKHNINVMVAKLDADANHFISDKYSIKGFPRMKLFNKQEFVDYEYSKEPTATEIF